MSNMIVNLHVKFGGDLGYISAYIDKFMETESAKFLAGRPAISRTLKFSDASKHTDPQYSHRDHGRSVNFKFNIPIETDACGRRQSPTSTIGKYVDDFWQAYQLRHIDVESLPSEQEYEGDKTRNAQHVKFAHFKLTR